MALQDARSYQLSRCGHSARCCRLLRPTITNVGGMTKWKPANAQSYSNLFFGTEGLARVTVKP